MAYYDTISLVSGDSKPQIDITLRDSNKAILGSILDPDNPTTWNPLDLTDQTVTVHFRALGSSSTIAILPCTVSNAVEGKCSMNWIQDNGISALIDLPAAIYEGEIVITHTTNTTSVLTLFDKLKFKVRDRF